MCTSNAAVTQSGITLFVVLWIHCHVISSVGVKNMNPEQLRAFYSAHFRFFKVRYSKALRAGDILYLRQEWVLACQSRTRRCRTANKSNLFDDVWYLPWSQSWCTYFCCQSLLRVFCPLSVLTRPKGVCRHTLALRWHSKASALHFSSARFIRNLSSRVC